MNLLESIRRHRRNRDCLEILRGFIAGFDAAKAYLPSRERLANDGPWAKELIEYGRRLVRKKAEIARFLETEMDPLNPDERYKIYQRIPGFFSEHVESIIAARLHEEKDGRCLERIRQIAAMPRDDISRARVAKRCTELFHAQQLLRHCDTGKTEAEADERLVDLVRIASSHRHEDLDRVDLLVLFALEREPNDRELFLNVIEGMTDTEVINHNVTNPQILEALIRFGQEERVRRVQHLGL